MNLHFPKYLFITIISILSLCVVACKEIDNAPIPADKMVDILADLHFAEYYSQGLGDKPSFKRNHDSLALYYVSVMDHHQITIDSFNAALNWYAKQPVLLDTVYNRVTYKLEQLRDERKKQ